MWSHLTPANLLDFQRRAALESLGERVLRLHREGYGGLVLLHVERNRT